MIEFSKKPMLSRPYVSLSMLQVSPLDFWKICAIEKIMNACKCNRKENMCDSGLNLLK